MTPFSILFGISFLRVTPKVEVKFNYLSVESAQHRPMVTVCSVYGGEGGKEGEKCNQEASKMWALLNSLQLYLGYYLTNLLTIPELLLYSP